MIFSLVADRTVLRTTFIKQINGTSLGELTYSFGIIPFNLDINKV